MDSSIFGAGKGDESMSDDAMLGLFVTIWVILCAGTPDLLDAIIHVMMK